MVVYVHRAFRVAVSLDWPYVPSLMGDRMFAFRNCGGVGKLSKSQRAKKARVLAEALERRQLLSAGDPDPSFGTNGATLLSFQGPLIDAGYSVTVDNQGRTVVAGNSYVHSMQSVIAVARYLPNGTLDTGFGNGGQVIVSAGFQDSASGVTTDSSGRVIVVGQTFAAYDPYYRTGDFLVARLNADGSMDTSFNGTGEAIVDFAGGSDYASKAVIQPDGRILGRWIWIGRDGDCPIQYQWKPGYDIRFGNRQGDD